MVIWDRLFGTWVPEDEPPVYGTLDGLPTYDVLDNGVGPFARLFAKMRRAPTLGQAILCLWMPPAWEPVLGEQPAGPIPSDPTPQRASSPTPASRALGWALVGFGLAGALLVTWNAAAWTAGASAMGLSLVLAALAFAGLVLDGRRMRRAADPLAQVGLALEALAGVGRGPVWHASRAVLARASRR